MKIHNTGAQRLSAFLAYALLVMAVPLGMNSARATGTGDIERLGKDLTPSGAERAGNRDGSIPPWTGGLTQPPAGWKPEMGYVDPFSNDKPLFVITAQTVDRYRDKLSPGLLALLAKYPDFTMPVYPSRRTFANPTDVYESTKAQASKVQLKGLNLLNYSPPGVPFPVPSNGVEAMYNHLNRHVGSYKRCTDWLPVQPNGDFYRVGFCEDVVQRQNFDQPQANHLFSLFGSYDAPTSILGTIYLLHDPVDYTLKDRQAWIYNPGQRRVRRAPDFGYDAATDGDEGMRTTDDYFGFNGAMDRYEWKLVGKREMYIPYNAYKVNDKRLKYKDILGKGSLKSELMRYELHRVWEVEATLKRGESHLYAKRSFFIDEDSHMIALSDAYDSRGRLHRTHILSLVQAYDAGVMFQAPFVLHDLLTGGYLAEGMSNERKDPVTWNVKRKWADFQPDAVRRLGMR